MSDYVARAVRWLTWPALAVAVAYGLRCWLALGWPWRTTWLSCVIGASVLAGWGSAIFWLDADWQAAVRRVAGREKDMAAKAVQVGLGALGFALTVSYFASVVALATEALR